MASTGSIRIGVLEVRSEPEGVTIVSIRGLRGPEGVVLVSIRALATSEQRARRDLEVA